LVYALIEVAVKVEVVAASRETIIIAFARLLEIRLAYNSL
jgi:hypothetical protein